MLIVPCHYELTTLSLIITILILTCTVQTCCIVCVLLLILFCTCCHMSHSSLKSYCSVKSLLNSNYMYYCWGWYTEFYYKGNEVINLCSKRLAVLSGFSFLVSHFLVSRSRSGLVHVLMPQFSSKFIIVALYGIIMTKTRTK